MKKKSKIVFGRLDLLRNDTLNNKSKIRIGFIGGGPNSFIGYTHRLSARFDNKFEFVAGIFSKDKKKSKSFGSSLGLADDRCTVIISLWHLLSQKEMMVFKRLE